MQNFESLKRKDGYRRRNDYQINHSKMKKKKVAVELNAIGI